MSAEANRPITWMAWVVLGVSSTGPLWAQGIESPWVWHNPLPTAEDLFDIWGNGPDDVYAVGYWGTIVHYDGTSWSRVITGATNTFQGVWGSGPDCVFVIGASGLIYRYNGTAWSSWNSGTLDLRSIWGTGPSNVFIVAGGGKILHCNGAAWSPMSSGTTNNLKSIWGSGSDVFAVGDAGTILHYNGISWSKMQSPTAAALVHVWGLGPNDVYAVTGILSASRAVLLHFDGSAWQLINTGTPTNALQRIWGTSPMGLLATDVKGNVWQYNSQAWSPVVQPPGTRALALWGSSFADVWAVGPRGSIIHFDGVSWSDVNHLTRKTIVAAWGSGPADIFAGGEDSIWHYDGKRWLPSHVGYHVKDIWGSSPHDVFAVGEPGSVLHFNGSSWSSMPLDRADVSLRGIWGNVYSDIYGDHKDVYAVGANGVIEHYDGAAWKQQALNDPTTANLNAVHGTGPNDIYAVGEGGTILHSNGRWWSKYVDTGLVDDFDTQKFLTVWACGKNDAWAGHDNGGILHYDGLYWLTKLEFTPRAVHSIWGSGPHDLIFAVDGNPCLSIEHYDGADWSDCSVPTYTSGTCLRVWGSGHDTLYLFGEGGMIAQFTGNRLFIENATPIDEGNGTTRTLTFPVSLTRACDHDVNALYTTFDPLYGTAKAGTDYVATSGTLTIPAGSTSTSISVPFAGDTLYQPDKTFEVRLSHIGGALAGSCAGTGTILNDDPIPSVSINDSIPNPQGGHIYFVIHLSVPSGVDVKVDYATKDDTAVGGQEYMTENGTLVIKAGQTFTVLPITVASYLTTQLQLRVVLSHPVNATLADAEAVGTIPKEPSGIHCGNRVGPANLTAFYALCWLGLASMKWSLRRTKRG